MTLLSEKICWNCSFGCYGHDRPSNDKICKATTETLNNTLHADRMYCEMSAISHNSQNYGNDKSEFPLGRNRLYNIQTGQCIYDKNEKHELNYTFIYTFLLNYSFYKYRNKMNPEKLFQV